MIQKRAGIFPRLSCPYNFIVQFEKFVRYFIYILSNKSRASFDLLNITCLLMKTNSNESYQRLYLVVPMKLKYSEMLCRLYGTIPQFITTR